MRVENTNIKLTIHIPIDKPDDNGVIYSKEAVMNALNNLRINIPIVYGDIETCERAIGVTTGTSHIVTWDSDNQVCKLTIDGIIFHGGAEIIVNEIKDGKVTDFVISGFGLTI